MSEKSLLFELCTITVVHSRCCFFFSKERQIISVPSRKKHTRMRNKSIFITMCIYSIVRTWSKGGWCERPVRDYWQWPLSCRALNRTNVFEYGLIASKNWVLSWRRSEERLERCMTSETKYQVFFFSWKYYYYEEQVLGIIYNNNNSTTNITTFTNCQKTAVVSWTWHELR